MKIAVVVQSPAEERPAWSTSRASIEASDIGKDYEVLRNPPKTTRQRHLVGVLRHLERSDADWCLRLEDDALVNRFILENLRSWKGLEREGVGWLFLSPPHPTRTHHDNDLGKKPPPIEDGVQVWRVPQLACSAGVLMRREDAGRIADQIEETLVRFPKFCQDVLFGKAIARLGLAYLVHHPILVEHQWDAKSSVTNGRHSLARASSGGVWDPDFRRANPSV